MTLVDIALLTAAGFAAGVVNAVAGGGTFFTFAALVATGLPTISANATSALALTPANIASVLAYREELRVHGREAWIFGAVSVIGAALGAVALIWLGDPGFRRFVPWLLLFATLLFAFSGPISRLTAPAIGDGRAASHGGAYALIALLGVYGGFFGAGIGIIMLAGLGLLEPGNFHKINAIKAVVATVIQAVAIILFIGGGLISWPHALVTMVAAALGGYLGVDVARRVPEPVVRAVVVAIGAALTAVFFLRG